MSERYPAMRADAPTRAFRDWTHPDGTGFRLVLEPPARHRIRNGDRRPVLTFVNVKDAKAPQVVRVVAEGFSLAGATDHELLMVLDTSSGAPRTGNAD